MKLEINRIDQNSFVDFINRLKAIDTFLYFKLRTGAVTSAVYLPQHDAVKLHTVEIKDIFSISQALPEGKELKVAFFDANKVLDALKMFNADQVQAVMEFQENEEDFVCSSMRLFNNELEITLACSDPSLGFKDLTDAQLQTIFDREGSDFDFVLDTYTLGKIKSLFSLDKEETFSITASNSEVRVKGKTYNYQANQSFNGSASEATLYKKYLNLLDREEYSVYVSGNKVVMKSNDSNTFLTIATCQTAE